MALRDLWIPPLALDADGNEFVFIEEGMQHSLELSEGIYYAYRGGFHADYPSLLDAIESAINGEPGIDGTYEFQIATPSESSDFTNGGIKLVLTDDAGGSVGQFGWELADSSFSALIKSVVGFHGVTAAATITGVELVGDYSRGGCFLEPPHAMRLKRGDAAQIQFRNEGHTSSTVENRRWGTVGYRRMRYGWVAAAHVHEGKHLRADYAAVARLAQGDGANLWFDVWTHGLSTHRPILLVHDQGDQDLQVDSHPFEVVYAGPDSDYANKFSESIDERSQEMADFWSIDLIVECHPTIGTYGGA